MRESNPCRLVRSEAVALAAPCDDPQGVNIIILLLPNRPSWRASMRKIVISVLVVLPLLAPSRDAKPQHSVAVCRLEKSAVVMLEPSTMKLISEVGDDASLTIILAGLDTEHPVMRGNIGESKLDVLRRKPEAVWLAETPTLGGVNIWTYFRKERVVILSKQYTQPAAPGPFGLMVIGKCE
jgi:hypothetical protein